jgi:serine/threonine protein kinase
VYETPERIFMVMEIMSGGELFDYVVEKGTLSEEEASGFIRQITSAMAYMHKMGIIHRDLKPENLLLKNKSPNGIVKIIDFGLAKVLANKGDDRTQSFLGTRGYLAPEMLQRNSYDKSIDMWALGVITFVLLCGCLPFDDDSGRLASESAARAKFVLRFPRWASNLSQPARDLLENLLNVDPKFRFTAAKAEKHPWVTGKSVMPNNYLASPGKIGKS